MDILISFLNFVIESLSIPIDFLIGLLPSSPFQNINIAILEPFIGVLNWFFPFGDIVKTLSAWCICIGVYYVYSIALRWLKVIE